MNNPVFTRKIALHSLFWLGVIGLLTVFYGHFTEQYSISFWFVLMLMPVVMGTVYFINYRLVPRFLLRERWWKFALYFVYTLIISIYLQLSVVVYTYINLAEYQYQRMNPISSDVIFLVFGIYFVVFLATSIKMLRFWYANKAALQQVEQARLEASLKLKETELKVLRGQIQPHFLFNTLNNLYGLALEKADVLPDSILKLSSILDFLVYRSEAPFIPLQEELNLLDSYVALERLRFEDRLEYSKQVEGQLEQVEIPPFVLFTFAENAFTHGFSQPGSRLSLHYKLLVNEGHLVFEMRNSLPAKAVTKENGGVGLANVKARLHHFYGRTELNTTKGKKEFVVQLKIDLTTQLKDGETV
jgi:sensor histidine kinase YesM